MLKDWLYDKVVRKNDRIRREYERYVRGHLGEHRKKRLKHWFVLLVLSWKYRDGRQDRIPSAALIKQKKDTARIRMEWIPGQSATTSMFLWTASVIVSLRSRRNASIQ